MLRVCPERDAICPHGMDCPHTIDRHNCGEGWRHRTQTQNPAADLWSDYLDAETSMSTDDSGLGLYDIELMNEAAQVARIARGETE